MPAHSRGAENVEGYLIRVLAALCRQSKGEIRVKGATLDQVAPGEKIATDWDATTQEIVIRTITDFGEVYSVDGSTAWTRKIAQPPKQDQVSVSEPSPISIPMPPASDKIRVTTMDTERIVELENKIARQSLLKRIREYKKQEEEASEFDASVSSATSGRSS